MDKSGDKIQVLVIDDSPVYRKLVEHVLCKESYTLLFAKSGEEAMKLFAEQLPPIVITDWMMPDFSGLEICQRIRGDAQGRFTYIIVLTGITEKENVVKGLAAGADDYLTKPFYPAELLARIGVGRRMIELHGEIDAKNKLLEQMAHTDPLTKLPNRRAIEDWSNRQLRGAARHDFPFWVVLADLDCFKKINDTYGHDAGDAVLQGFADILRVNTRASDLCGRMGGDEFLLVITHVEQDKIHFTIDRLREQWSSHPFTLSGQTVRMTASFGIAGFRGKDAPDFSGLVQQADKALYAAKHAGKNQTKVEMQQSRQTNPEGLS
jgi:diguanylate cyclase (GGDEF)-like protein